MGFKLHYSKTRCSTNTNNKVISVQWMIVLNVLVDGLSKASKGTLLTKSAATSRKIVGWTDRSNDLKLLLSIIAVSDV